MNSSLRVKYPQVLWDFNQNLNFLDRLSEKYTNMKFHENPSSWSRVVPCGQTDGHDKAKQSFFAILRTRLKADALDVEFTDVRPSVASYLRLNLFKNVHEIQQTWFWLFKLYFTNFLRSNLTEIWVLNFVLVSMSNLSFTCCRYNWWHWSSACAVLFVICDLSGCTIFFFPTLSHKRQDFRQKYL